MVQPLDITHAVTLTAAVVADSLTQWYAQLDSAHSVKLQYDLGFAVADTSNFSGFQIGMNWQPSDVGAGSDPSQFVMRVTSWDLGHGETAWRAVPGTPTHTPNGLSAYVPKVRSGDFLYDFDIGTPATVTLSTSAGAPVPEGGAAAPATRATSTNTLTFDVRLSQPAVDSVSVAYRWLPRIWFHGPFLTR